jgi:hypothetical protein
MSPQKVTNPALYLGDGTYVRFSGYDFMLYTSNGKYTTNEIYLDWSMIEHLVQFARKQRPGELEKEGE